MKHRLFLIILSAALVGIVAGTIFSQQQRPDIWLEYSNWDAGFINSDIASLSVTGESADYSAKFDAGIASIQEKLGESYELTDYVVVIDVSEQREYVFNEFGELYGRYIVSTGAESVTVKCEEGEEDCEDGEKNTNRTMTESIWRIRSKTKYDPNSYYGPRIIMLEKYQGGVWVATYVGLHGTSQPEMLGFPESLGCVYHNNADIIALYEVLEIGDLVVAIE